MNWRSIVTITGKDLKVVTQSKTVLVPLIVVPIIMLVVLPALASLAPNMMSLPGSNLSNIGEYLQMMPAGLQADLAGLSQEQATLVLMVMYMLAPMYLIVPLMVASVIAADSFAGEKERKTLEALLYTPTTDRELFVAKLLAAMVPSVAIGLIGFVLYGLVANAAGWPVMGRVFFPNLTWVALAVWVGPAAAGLGLTSMVIASVRANTFQEAYQMGTMVVLPVVLLVIGQATGVIYFNVWLVLVLGLALWAIDLVLLRIGERSFRRGEIIARL
jgi:hypothetical protein